MKQDKQMFGENNEIGYVLGNIGIVAFYVLIGVVIWGVYKLL